MMKALLTLVLGFALCFSVSCGGSEEPKAPEKAEETKKEEPKTEAPAEKAEEKKDQ